MKKWIAIELAALAATFLVACVQAAPPQGTGSSTMASSDGRTAAAGAPDCDSVCAHLLECRVQGIDNTCPQQCRDGGYDQATITQFQNASCEEIPQLVAQLQRQGQPQQNRAGYHYCTAAGVWESCPGDGYCRDQDTDSSGDGDSLQAAQNAAVQQCNHHMNMMVINSQISGRASVKQSCQVTSCK
jgi:hypothetical protein